MGYGPGAVELVAGTNNPARPEVIDLVVWTKATFGQGEHTRAWVDSDRPVALARKAQRLAERYGNTYVSVGTYGQAPNPYRGGKLQHSRSAPQPRRCIILDDVRDLSALPLPPTWATETSPGNYQVGYVAEELLSPAQAERLARGAAELTRADGSGWDATQLIRLAGTLNTKPKCAGRPGSPAEGVEPEGWRVRLRSEGPRYPAATLFRAFAPFDAPGAAAGAQAGRSAGARTLGDVGQGDELWRRAAWREELRRAADHALPLVRTGRGGLLGDNGLPRGLTHRQPGYAILEARQRGEITYQSAGGSWDASRERYSVIKSLFYIGYNRAEVAALALRLADFGVEVKGAAAIWLDIARCIWLVSLRDRDTQGRPVVPIYKPRRPEPAGEAPPVELPAMPRPRKGRPAGARAAQVEKLGELLAARVGERLTRPQLAALLAGDGPAVGVRAICTYIAELRASAAWAVELRALGRGGLLVERCEKRDRNSEPESGIDGQERGIAPGADPHQSAEPLCGPAHGDHTPPDLPACPAPAAPAPPDLAELVAEWVDAYGYRWRPVKKAALLDGFDLAEVRKAYDAHPWRCYRLELRALPDQALLRRCKLLARSHQRAITQGDARRGWYERRFEMAEEERRRRGLDLLSGKRGRRVDFDTRRQLAAAAAERLGEQARTLRRRGDEGRPADLWTLYAQNRPLPPPSPRPRVTLGACAQVEQQPVTTFGTPDPYAEARRHLVERISRGEAIVRATCAD